VEVAGGYQFLALRSQTAVSHNACFPVGWFGEAAVPVSKGVTVVGELSGHYRRESAPAVLTAPPQHSRATVHTFLAGARVVGRRDDGLSAFFDVFAGVSRMDVMGVANRPFTLRAGGGGATIGYARGGLRV
jgi:hypothetical protein